MQVLLILPILIPFIAATCCLLAWRRLSAQRVITTVAMVALVCAATLLLHEVSGAGILVTQVGSWPAPFGISLVADLLSAIMTLIAAIVGLTVAVYSLSTIDHPREAYGYHPLLHVLLMGVSGSFLTGDIFNLFVWFEVMLIASFVLTALGGERAQLDGATKYVTLNLIASSLLLSAVGMLYGLTGTLNMADLVGRLAELDRPGITTCLATFFLVAFGIKSAAFPLFFWLPASYHTPPVAVSAVFAGLLTKVGVYALIRSFTLIFTRDPAFTHELILVLSGLTMVTGVLGAAAQGEFRRILSFHIVSQIGYMMMGLGMYSRLALAGAIFFIVHNIIVKTNLFFISGVARHLLGTYELHELGGLYKRRPVVALSFLISALSLAGIPPLSGFWGKFFLVEAGLSQGQLAIVATSLVVSFLTLYSMTKIWNEAFWKPTPEPVSLAMHSASTRPEPAHGEVKGRLGLMLVPVVSLASLSVALGVFAAPFYALTLRAAEQLLDPAGYVTAVLGAQP